MKLKLKTLMIFSILFLFQVFSSQIYCDSHLHPLLNISSENLNIIKTAYYTIEYDPILNITRLSYTSVLEINNNGQTSANVEVIDFALDINSSTIQLLPGTPMYYLLKKIGPITMIAWRITVSPGTTYLKYSADAINSPLTVNEEILVNGTKAELAHFMDINYIVAGIGSIITLNITLINNLQDIGVDKIVKPPIYCTLSFQVDTRYLEVIDMKPDSNSSSASGDLIRYNWNLLFENKSNIIMNVKVVDTTVWGTVPIESITIQAAACPEDVFNIIESQLSSLSSMISAVNTSYTLYKNLGDGLLNMSESLDMMVNGANESSKALYAIGSEMINQGKSAAHYVSFLKKIKPLLKKACQEISMINASGIVYDLNHTLSSLYADLQDTINQLEDVDQLLLEMNDTLTELLNQTLNPDQRQLILNAIENINQAYYTITSIIDILESALQLIESLQETVVFLEPQLIETQNAILEAMEVTLKTLVYVEDIPSSMIKLGNALIEIAEGNEMMSESLAYIANASSYMANATLNAASELESKLKELKGTYDGLETQYNALKAYKSMLNSISPSINPIKIKPPIISLSPFKLDINQTENIRLIIVEGAVIPNATNCESQLVYVDDGYTIILAPNIVNQTVFNFYDKEVNLTKQSSNVNVQLILSTITEYEVYSFIAVYQPTLAKEFKVINVTIPPPPSPAELPYIPYIQSIVVISVIIIAAVVILRKIKLR